MQGRIHTRTHTQTRHGSLKHTNTQTNARHGPNTQIHAEWTLSASLTADPCRSNDTDTASLNDPTRSTDPGRDIQNDPARLDNPASYSSWPKPPEWPSKPHRKGDTAPVRPL